jgi:hypothetical protein
MDYLTAYDVSQAFATVTRATEFCTVGLNICGPSACDLFHVTPLAYGNFEMTPTSLEDLCTPACTSNGIL